MKCTLFSKFSVRLASAVVLLVVAPYLLHSQERQLIDIQQSGDRLHSRQRQEHEVNQLIRRRESLAKERIQVEGAIHDLQHKLDRQQLLRKAVERESEEIHHHLARIETHIRENDPTPTPGEIHELMGLVRDLRAEVRELREQVRTMRSSRHPVGERTRN